MGWEPFNEEDTAFVRQLMPEGAVPSTLVAVVAWLDPETAQENWCVTWAGHEDLPRFVGMLELAKVDVTARMSKGEMFLGRPPDDA